MVKRVLAWLSLGAVAVGVGSGCQGGCWLTAEAVTTDPQTECLHLFAGQHENDPTVCAVPQLGGTNNCNETLNLPKVSETGTPMAVAPGGKIAWRLPEKSVAPGVVVTARGSDARTYTVMATLGDQPITITVPVHDD
jgi:hypothetical protein